MDALDNGQWTMSESRFAGWIKINSPSENRIVVSQSGFPKKFLDHPAKLDTFIVHCPLFRGFLIPKISNAAALGAAIPAPVPKPSIIFIKKGNPTGGTFFAARPS